MVHKTNKRYPRRKEMVRIKNLGSVGALVADTELNPGATSEDIDPILARRLVAESRGALAIAPEREHTPEELEHADEKPQPDREEPVIEPQRNLREELDEEGSRKKKPGRNLSDE